MAAPNPNVERCWLGNEYERGQLHLQSAHLPDPGRKDPSGQHATSLCKPKFLWTYLSPQNPWY